MGYNIDTKRNAPIPDLSETLLNQLIAYQAVRGATANLSDPIAARILASKNNISNENAKRLLRQRNKKVYEQANKRALASNIGGSALGFGKVMKAGMLPSQLLKKRNLAANAGGMAVPKLAKSNALTRAANTGGGAALDSAVYSGIATGVDTDFNPAATLKAAAIGGFSGGLAQAGINKFANSRIANKNTKLRKENEANTVDLIKKRDNYYNDAKAKSAPIEDDVIEGALVGVDTNRLAQLPENSKVGVYYNKLREQIKPVEQPASNIIPEDSLQAEFKAMGLKPYSTIPKDELVIPNTTVSKKDFTTNDLFNLQTNLNRNFDSLIPNEREVLRQINNNLNKNILKYSNPGARFSQSRYILGNKKNSQISQINKLENIVGRKNNYDSAGNVIKGKIQQPEEVQNVAKELREIYRAKRTANNRPDTNSQQDNLINEIESIASKKPGLSGRLSKLAISDNTTSMGPIGVMSLLSGATVGGLAGGVTGGALVPALLLGGAEVARISVTRQAKKDALKIINLLQLEGKARVLTPKEKNIINNASRVLGAKVGQALTLKTTPDAYKK
jgi:hypothetical protein